MESCDFPSLFENATLLTPETACAVSEFQPLNSRYISPPEPLQRRLDASFLIDSSAFVLYFLLSLDQVPRLPASHHPIPENVLAHGLHCRAAGRKVKGLERNVKICNLWCVASTDLGAQLYGSFSLPLRDPCTAWHFLSTPSSTAPKPQYLVASETVMHPL